jgi:hypothetical protein
VVVVLKRRFAVLLSALILVVSLYIGASLKQQYVETGINYGAQPTVIIDAGHPALKNTKNTIDFKIYKASPKKMQK